MTRGNVGKMPRRLDMQQAGAGATTGLTALQGIDDARRVGRDETVLIFATGAVGTSPSSSPDAFGRA